MPDYQTPEWEQEDLDKMEADLRWWQVLETYIPQWRVFGWTYRHSASIDTGGGLTIQLRGSQRDQIVSALFRAEGRIK
jgi:hypothetical protein